MLSTSWKFHPSKKMSPISHKSKCKTSTIKKSPPRHPIKSYNGPIHPLYAALLFALLPLTIYAQNRNADLGTPSKSQVQLAADGLAKQAKFPGGTKIMKAYTRRELRYPKKLAKKNIERRVTLRFMIMPDGKIDNIRPLRTTYPLFTEEAIRIIQPMP